MKEKRVIGRAAGTPEKPLGKAARKIGADQGESNPELDVLFDIANILTQSARFEDKASKVVEKLAEVVRADRVTLRRSDEKAGGLVLVAAAGPGLSELPPAPLLPFGESVSSSLFRQGIPIIAADYESHPNASPDVVARGVRSLISLPIMAGGSYLGVINLVSRIVNHFTSEQIKLVTAIGEGLGALLENAKLIEDLHAQEREISVVDEVSRIITSTLDIEQVYEKFAGEVKSLVDFDRMAINVADRDAQNVAFRYASGLMESGRPIPDVVPLVNTETLHVMETGQALLRDDLAADSRFRGDKRALSMGIRSSIMVPLNHMGRVIGTLSLRSRRVAAYGPHDQSILERLANQIAPAIGNAEVYAQLKRSEEAERLSNQELAALVRIASILAQPSGFEERCEGLLLELSHISQAKRVFLRIPDENAQGLRLVAVAGDDIDRAPPRRLIPYTEGISGEVYERDTPLVVNDYASHPRARSEIVKYGVQSAAHLPIKAGGKTLAVVTLTSREDNHFTPERFRLLTAVADGLGVLLESAGLQRESEAKGREIEVVDEVARIITSTLDIDQVYEQFATEVKKLVDFDRAIIHLIDEDAGTFVSRYPLGLDRPGLKVGGMTTLTGSQTEHVMTTGKTLIRSDLASQDILFPMDQDHLKAGLRSSIMVPLVSKGRVIGTLGVRSREVGAYGTREQQILERLANQIAPAVENAQLYEETRLAQEAQRQLAEENALVAEIGRIISSSLDLEHVYGGFAQAVGKLIPFDRISIWTVDTERAMEIKSYFSGMSVPGWEPGTTRPYLGTITGEVVRTKSTLLVQGGSAKDMGKRYPSLKPGIDSGLRSFLAVPLISQDQVTGTLLLQSAVSSAYSEKDVGLAERIGTQIAGVVANVNLYAQRKEAEEAEHLRNKELQTLFNIARILSQSTAFEQKCRGVLQQLTVSGQADLATLRVYDEERQGLNLIAQAGIEGPHMGATVSLHSSLSALAIQQGEPIVVNDYPSHPLAEASAVVRGLRSVMLLPIKSGDRSLGVINVISQSLGHFTPERIRLLTTITDGIGPLLENARLYQQVSSELEHRQQAEAALQESEARFRQLYDDAPVGYQEVDAEGRITRVNRTELEMLGYTEGEMLGRHIGEFFATQGSSQKDLAPEPVETNQHRGPYERALLRKDGTVVATLIEDRSLRNECGEIIGSRSTIQDITERKQTEERLQETARLVSIGELAAGVAHEINNPLTVVTGFSELLASRDLDGTAKGYAQKIFAEAQRASKVVQNLLSFARRYEPEKRDADVTHIVERALELKAHDFRINNIRLNKRFARRIPHIFVDEHQLLQALTNILTNAEQAILACRDQGEVKIHVRKLRNRIRISISDDGPGIAADDLPKIFDPFFTTKEVGEGTGLGLSICYGIVRQHGGNIWAESELGQGTAFHIELPIASTQADPDLQGAESEPDDTPSRRVLVVDDESSIRDLLSEMLSADGHSVDLASSAQEAWDMTQNQRYDVLLLDLKMPGSSGQDLFGLIRQSDPELARRVVFVTGDTVRPEVRDFLAETGNPVLSKPFNKSELQSRIRSL